MKQEEIVLKPIPELTGELPGDRLIELFKKLGWDGNRRVDPAKVKLHEADWRALVGREMDRAKRMAYRLGGSELDAAVGVGFLWMNWGPSGGGATPGMAELHPGWTEEAERRDAAGQP